MTTPKEAMELAISVMQDAPKSVLRDCAIGEVEQALASIQGEDAVERVAQTIREYCIGVSPASIQLSHGVERIYYAGLPVLELARAILATGLVPDEAAIRADEREKMLDKVCENLIVLSRGDESTLGIARVALNNAAVFICGADRAKRAIRSGGGE